MFELASKCEVIYGAQLLRGKILGTMELTVEMPGAGLEANAPPGPLLCCEGEEQAVLLRSVFKELGLSGVLAPKRSPHRTLGPWRLATRRGYFKLSEMGGEVSEGSHPGA